MCDDAGICQQQKEKISNEIGEITSIWYCGIKHRNIGLEDGISSWKDPNCTSSNIGMNGGVRAPIINRILDINRHNKHKIRPKKIKNNLFD